VPSLSVPSFGGKYENWATFANIFSVTLVSCTDVLSTEKFDDLLLALKGRALCLDEELPIMTKAYSLGPAFGQVRKQVAYCGYLRQTLTRRSVNH